MTCDDQDRPMCAISRQLRYHNHTQAATVGAVANVSTQRLGCETAMTTGPGLRTGSRFENHLFRNLS